MRQSTNVMLRSLLAAVVLCSTLAAAALPARSETIIDEWSSVKAPPPPQLQAVTVDPRTTALLVLDFVKQTCNDKVRPRCVASLPKVAKLIAGARASKTTVIYSIITTSTPADILKPVARTSGEPFVKAGPDKFLHTNLDQMLKAKGIKTVIVVGTTAEGAVLYTASHAAMLGYNVIIPVDGMSAESTYPEQYVAWNMVHAPLVMTKVKLTSIGMLTY